MLFGIAFFIFVYTLPGFTIAYILIRISGRLKKSVDRKILHSLDEEEKTPIIQNIMNIIVLPLLGLAFIFSKELQQAFLNETVKAIIACKKNNLTPEEEIKILKEKDEILKSLS